MRPSGSRRSTSNTSPTRSKAGSTICATAHTRTTRRSSFWDGLEVYVEVGAEKLDLRNLFEPRVRGISRPHHQFQGLERSQQARGDDAALRAHEERRPRCVLLLCGDHDPGGLHITETMRKNLEDLSGAVGWTPENLVIIRFGLNADFIDRHGLTWIDNLETSSGEQLDDPDHNDHAKDYVQDYIGKFGVRKCEANALVVEPDVGRQLVRAAILEHVPAMPSNAMSASSIAHASACAGRCESE